MASPHFQCFLKILPDNPLDSRQDIFRSLGMAIACIRLWFGWLFFMLAPVLNMHAAGWNLYIA
jgi:hypothetical protein